MEALGLIMMLMGAPSTGSTIDRVVVFGDRAKVTRTTAAACADGVATAVFSPLPDTLDVRTLRGESKAGEVIGVTSSVLVDEQAMGDKAKELTAKKDVLDAKIVEKQAALASLAGETQRVGEFEALFTRVLDEEVRNPQPAVASWSQTLDRFHKQESTLGERRLAVERELRDLSREQTRLSRRIERLGAASNHQARSAAVTVHCGQQPKVQVELTYLVPGALWRPEYDLDFSANRGKIGPGDARLTVAAVVQQSTGEDWSNVRISLSTAKPKLGAEAPYPAPLWITAQKEQKGKVLVEGYERRAQLEAGANTANAGPESAELEDNGQAVLLQLPHRVTVVADGRPYWSPVDAVEAKATGKLVAIPKLRPYVFRMVSLKNPAAYPLLEGRVHSFRGGSYVGDTNVTFKGAGEPMEVSLGIDEELHVERKTLTDRDRGAGFLSSTKHLARAYRITVKNRSKTREKVEVRENIPVSKIDDVKVELLAAGTTAGYQLDAKRGFLAWTLDLSPGTEKEVNVAYEVHLPEDWKASNF